MYVNERGLISVVALHCCSVSSADSVSPALLFPTGLIIILSAQNERLLI